MHPLNEQELEKYRTLFTKTDLDFSMALKILSDINRYRIFLLVAKSSRFSITNIAHILNISVPLASQHLRIMVHAKILQKQRVGKKIYPKLERHNAFVQLMVKVLKQRPL